MSKTLFHGPHSVKIAKLPIPAATTNDKCCVACAMWVRDINSSGGAASIIYIPLSHCLRILFPIPLAALQLFLRDPIKPLTKWVIDI